MNHAAAELYGSRCRIVAVDPDEVQRVVAHVECAFDDRTAAIVREFRRDHDLSQSLRVVLWPRDREPGVTPVSAKPGAAVSPPSTLAIRERVGPLIRAGFRVTSVSRPHEVLAELAVQQRADLAIALAFHNDGGCVSAVNHGVPGPRPAYLEWDAEWCSSTAGSGDQLARYQFAAALAPHLRQVIGETPATGFRILACGSMDNLRTAMAPLSEEFSREVQVLDHAWPGMLDSEAGTNPTEPALWQLARAAAQSAARGRHR